MLSVDADNIQFGTGGILRVITNSFEINSNRGITLNSVSIQYEICWPANCHGFVNRWRAVSSDYAAIVCEAAQAGVDCADANLGAVPGGVDADNIQFGTRLLLS